MKSPRTLPAKEQMILELLARSGAMFGLQMVEQSQGLLKRGTVYVTLGRIEAKGLVASEQEAPNRAAIGLPRRFYTLTARGERLLRAHEAFAAAMTPTDH